MSSRGKRGGPDSGVVETETDGDGDGSEASITCTSTSTNTTTSTEHPARRTKSRHNETHSIVRPSLIELSNDLLSYILRFLQGRDLVCLDAVARRFNMILTEPQLWMMLALQQSNWPFAKANRAFLELNILRHMRPLGSLESEQGLNTSAAPSDADLMRRMQVQGNVTQFQAPANKTAASYIGASTPASREQEAIDRLNHYTDDEVNWRRIVVCDEQRSSELGRAVAMLDMGSCTCVVGLGGQAQAPNAFPTISLSSTVVGDEVAKLADGLSHEHSISLPILHANETGVFTYAEPVFRYALNRIPQEAYLHGTILLADQLVGGQNAKHEMAVKRQKIADLIFKINPELKRVAFINESLLSLLATGRSTGIVLHIGFARSTCAVIVDSQIQNLASLPTRVVGGQLHSRMMLQSVFARGQAYQPSIADMFTHVPVLKRYCYVCPDPDEELKRPLEETSVEVVLDARTSVVLQQERFTSSEVFFFFGFPAMVVEAINGASTWDCNASRLDGEVRNAREHTQPTHMASNPLDQHVVTIPQSSSPVAGAGQDANSAASPETPLHDRQQQLDNAQHLHPSQLPLGAEPATAAPTVNAGDGAANMIAYNEQQDVHPELTTLLLQNIVLSGRSAAFPGFASRFQNDLNFILRKNMAAKVQSADLEATWLGGSMLCKLAVLDQLCITREEFEQDGIEAVLRHMEFKDPSPRAAAAQARAAAEAAAQAQAQAVQAQAQQLMTAAAGMAPPTVLHQP